MIFYLKYRACTTFLWKISYNDDTLDNEFKAKVFIKSFQEYQEEVKQAFELLSEPDDEKRENNSQILFKRSEFISNLTKRNLYDF
jgi:hypothetical protein